jgi:hypothetical protein
VVAAAPAACAAAGRCPDAGALQYRHRSSPSATPVRRPLSIRAAINRTPQCAQKVDCCRRAAACRSSGHATAGCAEFTILPH